MLEGGTITYEIIITNTGNETLEDITVEDTILGDLSDEFVDTLAPGDSDSATVEHETTGPADIHNVVTVEANGVISSTGVDATDDCDTRVLNPDIEVTKTCTAFAQVGDAITYTIRSPTPATRTSRTSPSWTQCSATCRLTSPIAGGGASESHDFTYEVTEESPDPVPNSVTARPRVWTPEET